MKRRIRINSGVIGGFEKELIEEILPQLSNSFRQRKEFWEYYFVETDLEFTLEDLDNLSSEFVIELSWEELIIKL